MFSILHISDLHRSPFDNITNAELISALVSDRERYVREDPAARPPDAIVVSGDIIQGVPLGTSNATAQLADQYSTASEFLVELADRFLGGDRSRVVIVPGNHDIDWVMSRAAMSLVPSGDVPEDLPAELHRADTPYRWSWKTRELYRISDSTIYEQRMDSYWRFFETFYDGVASLRDVTRGRPAHLYSLCDARIGVAAFNSCLGNDCFALHGSIPRDAVARAHLDLVDEGGFELLIAVWHHNVDGPPYRTDYMDIDIVRGMIGRGFRLGLYGHQHCGKALPVQIQLAARETMAVVSAGSLCAGARELPTGNYRGYNIIEIGDDMRRAKIHMREMSVANLFGPSRRPELGGKSWVELEWDPPADLAASLQEGLRRRVDAALRRAEADLKEGLPQAAKARLKTLGSDLPHFGRLLLLEAGRRTGDDALLLELLSVPRSIAELVELTALCVRRKDFSGARRYLEAFGHPLAVAEPHMKELHRLISTEEAMRV